MARFLLAKHRADYIVKRAHSGGVLRDTSYAPFVAGALEGIFYILPIFGNDRKGLVRKLSVKVYGIAASDFVLYHVIRRSLGKIKQSSRLGAKHAPVVKNVVLDCI